MADHHRHEKRLGRVIKQSELSCAWYRVLNKKGRDLVKPDHLLFEMEMRYCIKCNVIHWFLGEKIEFVQPEFNPNDYDILELREMGYFAQFDDASGK